jgi:phosphohistidine swiveling domain-containing protein
MKMEKFLVRNYSFIAVSLMAEAWLLPAEAEAATGIPDPLSDVEYARHHWRLDRDWIENVSRRRREDPPELFRRFIQRGQDAGNNLRLFSRRLFEEIGPDRIELSQDNLRDFREWVERFRTNTAFIVITHPLAKVVETKLLEVLLRHGVEPARLDQALLDLSITRKSNAAEEENFDLYFIQRRMDREDFDLEGALREHTRRHAYLKYRDPFSGGYPLEYFRERLREKLELPDYFQPYAGIIERFSREEKEWFDLHEDFVFFRTFRTERSYEALYYLERYLDSLERARGLEEHELSFFTRGELEEFLNSGNRIAPGLLSDRRQDFVLSLHGGDARLPAGEEARRWIRENLETAAPAESRTRGLVAYRGSAVGRARVLRSAAEQDRVEEGDILIVPMTTPDYFPSMKKAAAFVTDEGGVICHAAIVARELKKPCVIGTRNATSIFKDGDLVEVDALTGVVQRVGPGYVVGEQGNRI